MDHLRSVRFVPALRRLSLAAALASLATGCLVLLGWALNLQLLKSLGPGLPNMKVNTAIGFIFVGLAILSRARGNAPGRALCRILAAILVWRGSLKILGSTTGLDLRLDQWLFPESAPHHGSMALVSAWNFIITGTALLLLGFRWKRQAPSEWLAASVGLVAMTSLLARAHEAPAPFLVLAFSGIAVHTSLAFISCSLAIILADRGHAAVKALADGGPSGILARRLLPAAALVPASLGWLTLVLEERGLFSADYAFTVLIVAGVMIGVSFSMWALRTSKEAGAALIKEEERLRVTLRSIGDGVIAVDLEMRVTTVNAVAEDLTGWPQDEALGRPLHEVFRIKGTVEGNPMQNPIMLALRNDARFELKEPFILVARSGLELTVADSSAPIHDADGRMIGAVLVFRDVSAKQKAEKELLKLQKLESLAIMAGGIAHDFNNILSVILANVSLAATEAGPARAGCLSDAEAAVARGSQLSGQLMAFAKGSAAVRKPVILGPVIEEAAKFAMTGTKSRVDFDLGDGAAVADADPGQVSQVIENLVLNACQSMPDGGLVHIAMRDLELSGKDSLPLAPGHYHRIVVTDAGQGIKPEVLEHIFEPFYSTKAKGNGLGLASAFSIARDHRGYLMAETVLGHGSSFSFYLPASAPGIPNLPQKTPQKAGGRILVMDDDASIVNVTLRMLGSLGYRAQGAAEGKSAIALVEEALRAGDPYDAAILDLTVPGAMGGREAVQKILALQPSLKAIVASGYSVDPVMEEHSKYGFAAAMLKPYSLHAMSQVLNELIGDPLEKPSYIKALQGPFISENLF